MNIILIIYTIPSTVLFTILNVKNIKFLKGYTVVLLILSMQSFKGKGFKDF